jgi:hypothetical protein
VPGKYTVVLTVDGQRYTQPLTVAMDPRVKTPPADLQKQFALSNEVYQELLKLQPVIEQAEAAQEKIKSKKQGAAGPDAEKLDAAAKQLQELLGGGGGRRRRRGQQAVNLTGVRSSLQQLLGMLQEVDRAPTSQVEQQIPLVRASSERMIQDWSEFHSQQLAPLNLQ